MKQKSYISAWYAEDKKYIKGRTSDMQCISNEYKIAWWKMNRTDPLFL